MNNFTPIEFGKQDPSKIMLYKKNCVCLMRDTIIVHVYYISDISSSRVV